jgi:hypothetical protein
MLGAGIATVLFWLGGYDFDARNETAAFWFVTVIFLTLIAVLCGEFPHD